MNTNDKEFDEEDNHHKTMTGMEMETETYNNNHTTKMVAAAHNEGDNEHGAEQKTQVTDTALYDEEHKKGPKRCH